MDDERIERLLRGYRLPEVSPDLDHRVLREGAAIMARVRRSNSFDSSKILSASPTPPGT